MKIIVDPGACESNGLCVRLCPQVFSLDEDDTLHILDDAPSPDDLTQVLEAVRRCPRQALEIENSST